ADLLWWRRADADGQRAGSQGGQMLASASAPARAVVPRGDIAQSTNRSYIGGAVAYGYGNDGDDQMDHGAARRGHLDLSQSPTVLETAGKRTMRCENTIILRTDPFTFMFLELGINEVCEIARGIVNELRDLPVGVGFGYL